MKKLALGVLALITAGCVAQTSAVGDVPTTPSPTPTQASPVEFTPIELQENATIQGTVEILADQIGERNLGRYEQLEQTRDYLTRRLEKAGYEVELQTYQGKLVKKDVHNLIVTKTGSEEILVVGAHYDSATITPGANDNGSGVAVLLYLAEALKDLENEKTIRFVFFVNEEPPYFMTSDMGSTVYAKMCAERGDKIIGMLSLETMGYFSDEPESQHFPPGISGYPDTGNFLAFIAEPNSQQFLEECLDYFEGVPVESLVAPAQLEGVSWSDHASFWRYGYPGVMVTDTAPFRYPHYHRTTDTPEKLDYETLKRAAGGLEQVLRRLASAPETY